MKNWFYKLKLLVNLLKYKGFFTRKQYSKNKEDQYLKKIFRNKTKGTYIDIGAYHPYKHSNTYLLHRKGWNGINVDINKESIDLFNIARPNDKNLNIAIGNKNKIQTFYYQKKNHPMNTLNKKFASRFWVNKDHYKKNKIMTRTFDFLIKKIKKIDLLDIDVEGAEYDVIKKINFKNISFKIILIEHSLFDATSIRNTKKVKLLLLKRNYKYIKNFGETSVYKNKLY
jgi:FkbM family methyltransferase